MIGRRSGFLPGLGLVLLLAPPGFAQVSPGGAKPRVPISAEELIRAVARSQRRADLAVTASTFDQVEVRTDYGKDGRPKTVKRRRYQFFSGDEPGAATRELVEVDGRPATAEERREVAEDDAKRRKKALEREAEARASRPPAAGGDEDDPLVGPRRLSDLISRFSYGAVEETEVEGRPAYALEFAPRPGLAAHTNADRALNSLAGRVVVDAADFQVISADARLLSAVNLGGVLRVHVRSAAITYRALQVSERAWLPCLVDLRVKGRAAFLFRLDSSFRFEFSDYARFSVEVETEVGANPGPSVQSAP